MKTTLENNTEIKVAFYYPDKHKHAHKQKRTVCLILGRNNPEDKFEEINRATSYCNHSAGDFYSKTKGRKEALRKALKVLDRQTRTSIWQNFIAKCKYQV